jgi:hypothetical protein
MECQEPLWRGRITKGVYLSGGNAPKIVKPRQQASEIDVEVSDRTEDRRERPRGGRGIPVVRIAEIIERIGLPLIGNMGVCKKSRDEG